MSEYPYGYPFQGQPPQQHYPPSYQPYGTYPPTANYQAQTNQQPQPYPTANANYLVTPHSAYDFNASSIPGLGTASTGSSFPTPYNGHWDQPGYATSAPPTQPPAWSQSSPSISTPFVYPNLPGQASASLNPQPATPVISGHRNEQKKPGFTPQPKQQLKEQPKEQPKAPPKPQLNEAESQDEGEISDGYFDDLYDDVPNQSYAVDDPAATSTKVLEDVAADGSDQEPNFYDTDMEEAPTAQEPTVPNSGGNARKSSKTVEQAGRNHSRSYSPHLSPMEAQQNNISTLDESSSDRGPGRLQVHA